MKREYFYTLKNLLLKPVKIQQNPIHIQFEPTTYCNLNCVSCNRTKYIKEPKHLLPDRFTYLIEQIRPAKISLSGTGDSFTSPHLFTIIRLAKGHGCSINTTTNGTLLKQEHCEEVINSGLDLIKISIDAATPETYRKNRGVDKFLQILDGIRALTEAKKRLGSSTPFIRFNYVVYRENYHEISAVIELAAQLGVKAIYFQPLQLTGIEERQAALVGDLTIDKLSQEIAKAITVSQHHRVKTNLQDFSRKLPLYWGRYQMRSHAQNTRRKCLLPWFSAYITLEGYMRPCCACLDEETNMGNLFENSLDEIWNGKKYQQLRKAFREGKRPLKQCQTCVPQTLGDMVRYSTILPGFLK